MGAERIGPQPLCGRRISQEIIEHVSSLRAPQGSKDRRPGLCRVINDPTVHQDDGRRVHRHNPVLGMMLVMPRAA
jgi:hypothetical protein